jgi:hypothetical protein
MQTKICSKCEIEKEISEFHNDSRKKDGHYSACKKCVISRVRNYADNNKEKIRLSNKNYRESHKEKIIKYREDNKDYYKEYNKKYLPEYYRANKEEFLDNQREYNKNRRHTDLNFKLLCHLRNRIYRALKGSDKSQTTLELLGCSPKELKKHLISQFTDGMTWENYGRFGWVLDHIRPCASFDLSKESERKICFHYSNLQPLWWYDNIIKRDKYVILNTESK